MKKLVLTTLAACAFTAASFAQGTVNWSGVSGSFVGQTNGVTYSTFGVLQGATGTGSIGNTTANNAANTALLGYQGFYYALLVGSSASAPTTAAQLNSSWVDTGLTATNGAANNGRIIQTADDGVVNNTQATANGWPAGATTNVILVGWSANLGSTYAAALTAVLTQSYAALSTAAYFGVSGVGLLAANGGNPGVVVFGTTAGQINNGAASPMPLNVLGVPEPGTLALAALGGASLLLFRRKK